MAWFNRESDGLSGGKHRICIQPWSLYHLADRLRDRGWQVPAYRMPPNREDLVVQRVVVRNGFTCDLADLLVRDIRRHLDWFAPQPGLRPKTEGAQFHH